MAYANLNRLVDLRQQGIEPRGRRSQGPVERSRPTGYAYKAGNVTLQELEFSNGYVVGALQVEGQKAIIKGPEATANVLEAIKKGYVQECYNAWLEHVSKGLSSVPPSDASRSERAGKGHVLGVVHGETEASQESRTEVQSPERAAQEERLDRVEEDVASIKDALDQIVGMLGKEQTDQPKQS